MKLWQSLIILGMMCVGLAAARTHERSGGARSDHAASGEKKPIDAPLATSDEVAKTENAENKIPKKFWSGYFESRPKLFLVDPQGLLSPVNQRDRLAFLNYHADDSAIDLFVYVFKGNQEIPGEVRVEEMVERFFTKGRPAAVIFYYMGRPQRSVLYLSPALTDVIPPAEQKRTMESAVMQASKDDDPARQIEGFIVQMSIRIYWMEKILAGGALENESLSGTSDAAVLPVRKPTVMEKLQPLLDEAKHFTIPAAAGGVLLVVLIMVAGLQRRSRYRFPEFEVEPRLGGSHAAGVGAVICFVSAAVPPASQRDQVPDYLHRA
jgi:hypothetical protein